MRLRRPRASAAAALFAALLAAAYPAAAQTPVDPTAALLAELLRANTSNPPGNEGAVAELLAPRLRALGFEVTIVPTPEAGKSHLFARLRGDGSKRPVLLAAHADVVGVEREKWTHDPFAGEVADGYVYGRGAIDFKGGLAVFARAAMLLAERKVPLARDVILLAEADEENGRYNTAWLAREHWAAIDCEFALNEGGWIMTGEGGRVRYVSVSTADKTAIPVLLTARGTSTHASLPRPDNALVTLGRALARVGDHETPVQLTASTRRFFETLARTSSGAEAERFRDLASGDSARAARADRETGRDPLYHALVRNTIAPVLMSAGFRGNVIPGSAEATLNVRVLPGTDPADVVRELQRVVDDPRVEVRLSNPGATRTPSTESSTETELFRALERSARAQWPGAEVTPYLFQAGTDAGAWRSRGVPVYGIYPYPIDAEDLSRMHGNDERVLAESLRQGTEMIYRALAEVAGRTTIRRAR
jgi:acetylornithine deacetylase/succinyl-diaminopimelate desuccinylase-like protein